MEVQLLGDYTALKKEVVRSQKYTRGHCEISRWNSLHTFRALHNAGLKTEGTLHPTQTRALRVQRSQITLIIGFNVTFDNACANFHMVYEYKSI
jgi:hypothetical protein